MGFSMYKKNYLYRPSFLLSTTKKSLQFIRFVEALLGIRGFEGPKMSNLNSDIKPPLLVVDPERFYRSGEKESELNGGSRYYSKTRKLLYPMIEKRPGFPLSRERRKNRSRCHSRESGNPG